MSLTKVWVLYMCADLDGYEEFEQIIVVSPDIQMIFDYIDNSDEYERTHDKSAMNESYESRKKELKKLAKEFYENEDEQNEYVQEQLDLFNYPIANLRNNEKGETLSVRLTPFIQKKRGGKNRKTKKGLKP